MEKLKMQSTDKVQEHIKAIAKMFPNAVTEVKASRGGVLEKLDFDVLKQELADYIVSDRQQRYQFTWPDKNKAILTANRPINKTLRPCRAESLDFDNTENLYIEGDNLEVLKLLQETYLGKVKMIYIDPPYNTGKDFIYEDNFKQDADEYKENSGQYDDEGNRLVQNTESNGRFHTDWLNMMYPRLKLARDLLSDDGVIFISIDDNEQSNLSKICDEIFGYENAIGPIIQNKQNNKNDTINIQKNHEFILVYRKNILFNKNTNLPNLINTNIIYKNIIKDNNMYFYLNDPITTRGEGGTLNARPNLGYTIYYNKETQDKLAIADYNIALAKVSNDENEVYTDINNLIEDGYVPIRPPKVRGKLGCWTWSLEKFNTQKDNIFITNKSNSYSVRKRTFVNAKDVITKGNKLLYVSLQESNSKSILDFATSDGSISLSNLLQKSSLFNNPKNMKMIQYFINLIPKNDIIILDFFSGSATTAHAVMQLNAEDGGRRKFIMVQLPEKTPADSEAAKAGYNTICEIGKERIRRAGKKIKEEFGDKAADLDTGFRVLKADSSNMKDVFYSPADYRQDQLDSYIDNIKPDRTGEDLLFQVMLDMGIALGSSIVIEEIAGKRVYNVADNFLLACFDMDVTDEVITAIAKKQPDYVVLRDFGMVDDAVAVNFEQIFKTYSPHTIAKVL